MKVAPMSVRTFSDLGYFAFGETGRRVILLSEASVWFLSPIAFLILGGSILLPYMFEGTGVVHSVTEWIILMAAGVLPIVLIPMLKGTAPLCYLGCIVAVATDVICIFYSMHELKFSPRETEIETNHAVQTFGTIMFAMGTAIIIPPIQRQHTDPARLANLVSLTLLSIMSIYLLIGITTYYQFGCTAPATLLDQLPANQWRQLAAGLMFVHVLIVFPVLLNPTLFDLERSILGKDGDIEVLQQTIMLRQTKITHTDGKPILRAAPMLASLDADAFVYGSSSTLYFPHRSPTGAATTSMAASSGNSSPFLHEEATFTTRDRICSSLIRTFMVALQTFLAVMLQSSFMDILSLIGSTAITISCMIMPCLCYLKVHPISTEHFMGQCDKTMCYMIIITSAFLGVYCTVVAAGNISSNISKYHLFQPANTTLPTGETEDQYPYCHVGERN
ncbi:Amino acid/auxin permease, partial [Globisporangium splendens]